MNEPAQRTSSSGNLILSLLMERHGQRLAPHLEKVELPRGFIIAHVDQPIDYYYFPDAGVVSMVAVSSDGRQAETGLIGKEGVVPVAAILSGDRMPFELMMQLAGEGRRIRASAFVDVIASEPNIHATLLRYLQTLMSQTAFTALANTIDKMEIRLARWILMCHDRMDSDEIALTHEFMALMLGVRRPSVTEALHVLEGERLIYASRGLVTIRDRAGLLKLAGDAYGAPERDYRRILGVNPTAGMV